AQAASWSPAEWQIAEDEKRGDEPAPLVIPAIETAAAPAEPALAAEASTADAAESMGADADQSPDDGVIAPETAPSAEPAEGLQAPARRGVETVGGDAVDEVPRRRARPMRNYKIQEVIKRRQIMLVQVVKEERGNKGAALTTYLSLAGRYCVLMPNTTRGGGVSRKITNATDRRRLKSLLDELNLPQGMAVIVRTAGSERSRAEVKRDCDYLLKLWDEIRELTLKSTAPSLIYEEASLIKRSIRDLYARDIDEILVEGEDGYRAAKDFMKMLMPSHAKRVQPYREPIPLFHRFQIESQIDAMHSPVVQLRSGGYVVINPTEALVAIDVNSGRATRERFIEETALRTNLEAAEEIARQLRLRDLGGLVVIDFIDMEDNRNNHAVERRLKEALRFDRARIQVGRISPFGLLELSRQRLRPSITETSTMPCPHCGGTGLIRSTESAALHVLRAIEEEGI
ncbi:MAG: ribonuclease E/G, partial [Alphaproteobacteria bacterium]|nr:ribonuclease E/G [Alphaproteobacteria bacterium]